MVTNNKCKTESSQSSQVFFTFWGKIAQLCIFFHNNHSVTNLSTWISWQANLHIYICIHYSTDTIWTEFNTVWYIFYSILYKSLPLQKLQDIHVRDYVWLSAQKAQKNIYEAQIYSMHNITIYLVRFSINVSLHGYINMYAEQFQAWKAGHIKNILH